MLKNISICDNHRRFIDGRKKLLFTKGLNVVIGPNGSGKSTLLNVINECRECQRTESTGQSYYYFNSETMNPHKSEEPFKGINGSVIKVRAMFSSHGETMRDVLRFMKFKSGDCLLLDEPETGHDLKWIIKIRKGLDDICKSECQIIVASHNPVIWKNANIIELKRNYRDNTLKLLSKKI